MQRCRAFLNIWGCNLGLIKQAAVAFLRLKAIEYRIILSSGRDNPLEKIELDFCDNDLFHILGLQHLTDIDLPKKKVLTIEKIVDGSISDEYVSLSEHYSNNLLGYNIKQRVEMVKRLEQCLDADRFSVSVYKLQHDNHTVIIADYLITCSCKDSDTEYYIFIRKRRECEKYGIVSCFPKSNAIYWGGKRYLMLKEKIVNGCVCEMFRHPTFDGSF